MGVSKEERAKLEAEHGPMVFIEHPDGSAFGFKRMGLEQYKLRHERLTRETNRDDEADDKLLQERVVWPSRDAWNEYAARAAFEVEAYVFAYHHLHGRRPVRACTPDEMPPMGSGTALTNGEVTFMFRRPTRADVKAYKQLLNAGDWQAVEKLMCSCAMAPDFEAWLEHNLFGGRAFGDHFLSAFGARDLTGPTAAAVK